MRSAFGHSALCLARFVFLGAALLTIGSPANPAPVTDQSADPAGATASAPEVRLRKLHLVRPDLIPYPIAYDVYC